MGSEDREAVDWNPDSWPRLELTLAPEIWRGSYSLEEEDCPTERVRMGAW